MGGSVHKHPRNVPGKYYVVYEQCLAHEVCNDCAPSNFTVDFDDEWAGAHVYKQPATAREEKQCQKAKEGCPTGAIQDDGETNLEITYWISSQSVE